MAAVGSEYERLLAGFLAMGGDPAACPFDAEGYVYILAAKKPSPL